MEKLDKTAFGLKRRTDTFGPPRRCQTKKMNAAETHYHRVIIQLFRNKCILYNTPFVIILIHFSCESPKIGAHFR
jgi:hypothetical protein